MRKTNEVIEHNLIELFSNYTSDKILEETILEELEKYLTIINTEDLCYIISKSDRKYLFLSFDTNLLLDIFWRRNSRIFDLYKRLIDKKYYLIKENEIILSTTIVNIVEFLDILKLYSSALVLYEFKASPDEIINLYRGLDLPRKYKNNGYFDSKKYKKICESLKKFCKVVLSNFWILYPDIKPYPEDIVILRNLIFRGDMRDKDTLIIWIINSYSELIEDILHENVEGPYFLTSDKNLAEAEPVREREFGFYIYNLKNERTFKEFIDNVLKSWIDVERNYSSSKEI